MAREFAGPDVVRATIANAVVFALNTRFAAAFSLLSVHANVYWLHVAALLLTSSPCESDFVLNARIFCINSMYIMV